MAERHQAAIAHEELQARSKERQDRHLGGDHQGIVAQQQRQRGKRRDQRTCEPANACRRETKRRMRGFTGAVRGDLRPAKQAIRSHDQHGSHDDEDQHQRRLRQQPDAEGMQHTDDQRGPERAGDRAEPADDDDDKGLDQDRQVHLQVDGLARDLQCAGQPGEPGAERKHRREQQAFVDAERTGHLAVLRRRAHDRAPARAMEQPPQQRRTSAARPPSAAGCTRARALRRSGSRPSGRAPAARTVPPVPTPPARGPA